MCHRMYLQHEMNAGLRERIERKTKKNLCNMYKKYNITKEHGSHTKRRKPTQQKYIRQHRINIACHECVFPEKNPHKNV